MSAEDLLLILLAVGSFVVAFMWLLILPVVGLLYFLGMLA